LLINKFLFEAMKRQRVESVDLNEEWDAFRHAVEEGSSVTGGKDVDDPSEASRSTQASYQQQAHVALPQNGDLLGGPAAERIAMDAGAATGEHRSGEDLEDEDLKRALALSLVSAQAPEDNDCIFSFALAVVV
jgi:hypothetical protein